MCPCTHERTRGHFSSSRAVQLVTELFLLPCCPAGNRATHHITSEGFSTLGLHILVVHDFTSYKFLSTCTILFHASAHGRLQLNPEKSGVGPYTEEVLELSNYARASTHLGSEVS